jgi:hypothetical protein
MLLELRNEVWELNRHLAAEKRDVELQRLGFEKLARYKEELLLEKIKEVDAKNAALQVLAARKTFAT